MLVNLQHTVHCGWFSTLITRLDTTPTRHSPNAVSMLGQRLRRWPNIEPALEKYTMFERKSSCPANTKHLYNIYATSANIVQSHTNVLCSLGVGTSVGSTCFEIPAVIQSVCLQASDLLRSRTKGFEIRWNYQLIDVAQVYMSLLWFENLLLMRLWV